MTEKAHASLDRIEEGLLVCYTDDDRLFTLPAADYPEMKGGEAVELTITDGRAVALRYLAEETEQNRKKTKSLFAALLLKKNN